MTDKQLEIRDDKFIKVSYGALVAIMAVAITFAGAFYSVQGETSDNTRRLDRQTEFIEAQLKDSKAFEKEISQSLSDIKSDIAVIKSKLERR